MKTLQLGLEWFPERGGGLDRIYYGCTRHLPKVDVEVTGLVAGSTKVLSNSNGTVQAFASPDASLPHRWQSIRRSMDQLLIHNHYHLVASHFALHTFPVLDQLRHLPLVIHFHGPWALESSVEGHRTASTWFKFAIEQVTYWRATRFIVLSEAFRQVLHETYRIPLNRIHIVPGGVDSEAFNIQQSSTEARTQLGWDVNRPIIFTVRRLVQRMGLENLITAMDKVRQQCPEALLIIAGKGALEQALRSQIQSMGLSNHIQLLGFIPDQNLGLAYRAANFCVVPTVSLEGFGLIVVESLAAGTPVLGTAVGGIPEILRSLSENLLIPDSSPQTLAQYIIDALSGQRQLPDRKTCQAYAKEHYDWQIIAEKIKLVYQSALAN